MKNPVTRRHFLATAGAAASVTLLSQPLFDGSAARAAVPLVRRDVGKMDANDPILVAYGNAIQKMQSLPNNNPHKLGIPGCHSRNLAVAAINGVEHLRARNGLLLVVAPDVLVLVRAHYPENVQ